MILFNLIRFKLVGVAICSTLVCACVGGQAFAQTEPSQTLLQEEPAKKAEVQEKPADQANTAPPSLSDYIDGAGSEQAATTETTSDINFPPVDGAALQAADAPELSQEAIKANADAKLRQEVFKAAADQMMPMKPSEIRRMLELYDETKQASVTPVYATPEPESSFQGISLDPGTKPLVIKTAIGNVTTLSIVDVTGQPWPIQDLTWAGDFQIEQPESGAHMLRITPTSEFAKGNISMRLVGLNPPVIFTLSAERKSVHVRLDVQIPEVGPKGVLPPMDMPISTKAGDDFMTSVLVGVVSGKDTAQLKVDGIDGRTTAYSQGGMIYVRTPYTMLSPAWAKSVQSGDGTKVYALNYTPVILLSDKGKMVRAYLSPKETSDEQY